MSATKSVQENQNTANDIFVSPRHPTTTPCLHFPASTYLFLVLVHDFGQFCGVRLFLDLNRIKLRLPFRVDTEEFDPFFVTVHNLGSNRRVQRLIEENSRVVRARENPGFSGCLVHVDFGKSLTNLVPFLVECVYVGLDLEDGFFFLCGL